MLAQERYEKILEILERDNSVKVSMLTKLFNVSIETVRRDLEYLEKEGYLQRVYGGAVLKKVSGRHRPLQTREQEYVQQKVQIANAAIRFISEGQSIALDAGTTTLEIAKTLKSHFQQLTVVTNCLLIANELAEAEGYTIILCGGIFKKSEYAFVGAMAEENISHFHVDTTFIGASGISLKEGITDYDFDELQIQKKMLQISQQNIILADSSKFGAVSLLKVCDLDQVNIIITDSGLSDNVIEKYGQKGIEVVTY